MSAEPTAVREMLAGYEVGDLLGHGASGVVYDGRHRELDRQVAIKQLHPAFGEDPAVRSRFVSEARVLASLDHPHIVPVYDFVQKEGLCVLVMEKLTGGTVWNRFTTSGMTADDACAVALATCAALQFAHEHGVLHRDIKPDNLLFATTGVLKVTDFGIAKVVGGPETLATRTGGILGTPAYMAPEQALAEKPTPATDVYATGVMLYELLSGHLPFSNEGGPLAVIYRHVYEQPIPLLDVADSVPTALAAIVMRAIATRRENRFASADELQLALSEAAADAWGSRWLSHCRVPVVSTTAPLPITSVALDGGSGPPGDIWQTLIGASSATVSKPDVLAMPPPAAAVIPTIAVAADITLESQVTTLALPEPAPIVPVRPSDGRQERDARAESPAKRDLVPVRELLSAVPLSPAGLMLVAPALLLLVLALALVGLGSPQRNGAILPGTVTVGGADPAGSAPPRLNLGSAIIVNGRVAPGLKQVGIQFTVLGARLGARTVDAHQNEDGSFATAVDMSGARFLVAGQTTARLELIFAGQNGAAFALRRTFAVTSKQPSLVSVPGAVGIALLLFVLGYAESFLRCIRHGARVRLATVGLVTIGVLTGALAVDLAWVGGGKEPVLATLLPYVLLGAGAGVVGGRAAWQIHRRREVRGRLGAPTAVPLKEPCPAGQPA